MSSLFGFGGSAAGNGMSNPAKLAAAEAELDMVTDMFNRLVDSCYAKCINLKYDEGSVNKSESLCLDRCVAKYFEVNTKVGENMQKVGQSSGGAGFMGRP